VEGKDALKKVLLVIFGGLSLFVFSGLLALFLLSGKIIQPVHLTWGENHVEVYQISPGRDRIIRVSDLKFHNGDLKLQIPSLKISLSPWPPFLKGLVIEGPEVWIKGKGKGSTKPPDVSKGIYRLLKSVKIEDAKLHYSSKDVILDVTGMSLNPVGHKGGDHSATLFHASFLGRKGKSHLNGRISATLDLDSLLADLTVESRVAIDDKAQPFPFKLKARMPLPEDFGKVGGTFSIDVPKVELIPHANETGVSGSAVVQGSLSFSSQKGLASKGKVLLPVGLPSALKVPFLKESRPFAYSVNMPADFSTMTVDLVPPMKAHSRGRLKVGYRYRKGRWSLSSRLLFKGLSGARDSDHAFEDVDLRLEVDLKADTSKPRDITWKATASWDRGQVLFYPWFFDLSTLKASLGATGSLSGKELRIKSIAIKGPKFPLTIYGKGIRLPVQRVEKNMKGLFQRISVSSLEVSGQIRRLYEILLKDPFSDIHPVLLRLEPSGAMRLETKGRILKLRVESDLFLSKAPLIEGLDMAIPYPYKSKACQKGSISWKAFFLKNLLPSSFINSSIQVKIRNRLVPMTICTHRISAGPLDLDLQYGDICVQELKAALEGRSIALKGICIRDLDIKRLLKDFPYDMKVSASNISAELRGARLVFSGQIRARIAGGTIIATNIWIEPFAPIVRYGADIRFEHLDLRRLTEPTSFGVVSGIVNGRIKHLVMSGVQPERFDFVLRNDESADVPKKISIKAVENLSILGGGQGSVSFLGYFFKEFSYRRIGISCSLNNDVFVLHGLIKKGGKEYLVERGAFGGVNVINMNPGGRIRFRDMVERLKRITETENSKMEVR